MGRGKGEGGEQDNEELKVGGSGGWGGERERGGEQDNEELKGRLGRGKGEGG